LKNYFISSAKVLQKSEKQKDFSKKTLFSFVLSIIYTIFAKDKLHSLFSNTGLYADCPITGDNVHIIKEDV